MGSFDYLLQQNQIKINTEGSLGVNVIAPNLCLTGSFRLLLSFFDLHHCSSDKTFNKREENCAKTQGYSSPGILYRYPVS